MLMSLCWYAVIMATAKRKVTFYIAEDVLRAAKVRAARTDQRDSEVVEKALRGYLGFDVVDRVWARSNLSEKDATALAVAEQHKARRPMRARRP
jgi:hypothetical protein